MGKRFLLALLCAALCITGTAFGYTGVGVGSVWSMRSGTFVATPYDGTNAGVALMDASFVTTGLGQLGPGTEGLTLPSYLPGHCYLWARYDAWRVVGTPFESWPRGVRQMRVDSLGVHADSVLTTPRLGPYSTYNSGGAIRIVDGVTFPINGIGVQAAIDECYAVGTGRCRVILPGGPIPFDSLRLMANVPIEGSAMNTTEFVRSASATGTAIRDRSTAEGNPSGATGIWLRNFKVNGNGSQGDGIVLGNNASTPQLNINAGIEDVFVANFPNGIGITLNGNSSYGKHFWSNSNKTGMKFTGGGSNNYYGAWAEGNDSIQVIQLEGDDKFFGMHLEETTVTNKGPSLFLTSDGAQGATDNVYYGLDIFLNQNRTNMIRLGSGLARNQFYNINVHTYTATWTNTFYSDAFGTGTGSANDVIPFLIDMDATHPGYFRTAGTDKYTSFVGSDILAGSKVTIADSLRVNRTTELIGNVTVGPGNITQTTGIINTPRVVASDSLVANKAIVTRDGALAYGVRVGDGLIGAVATNGPLKLYARGTGDLLFETNAIQRGKFGTDGHFEVGDTLRVAGRADHNNAIIQRQDADIASAATIAIGVGDFFSITGTTTSTDVTGPAVGTKKVQEITFFFTTAVQFTSGNHWKLNGNFVANGTGNKDALYGAWDGTDFTEIGRSIP